MLTALVRSSRAKAAALLFGLFSTMLSFAPGPARAHDGHPHPDEKSAPTVPITDRAQRLPDGILFAPKPVQRIFGVRTALVELGTHRRSIELPGRIIPDPNASGFVQAAVGGRISPPPGGFPRLGTPVKKGDVLAHVTPPMQAIDVSDMRQRQGELDQQISIAERRLVRYEQLHQDRRNIQGAARRYAPRAAGVA